MLSYHIAQIQFSSGQVLDISPAEIVIFVGPNNSGKSETLRNILAKCESSKARTICITGVECVKSGTTEDLDEWLQSTCTQKAQQDGGDQFYSFNGGVLRSHAHSYWNHEKNSVAHLTRLFVSHLSTEARLNASNPASSISLYDKPPEHPIHLLQRSKSLSDSISSAFRHAFGKSLLTNDFAGSSVPLVVGEPPSNALLVDGNIAEYGRLLSEQPQLHKQGDGMKSFVGTLLHALAAMRFVILLDEPEAFLHPPQARILGNLLGSQVPSDRQLFVATHSTDFIKGILQTANTRVKVVRLNRDAGEKYVSILD